METRAITPADYDLLLELDKKVYPTDSPVTPKILNNWYKNNPEFGIIFEEDNNIVGVCIAIPLNLDGWKKLIGGELPESGLNENTIFDNSRDKGICIHIYHIEKFDSSMNKFYETSLKELSKLVNNLKTTNLELKVVGFSALSVTAQGISLFEKKLNCKERDYVCSEHILEKDGKLIVLDTTSQKEIDNKLKEGYVYKNKCKMLVTHPNKESVVWQYFK